MTYTKPSLRESIKNRVMSGTKGGASGQWSARKAQMVAQQYKAAGGGYTGPKTSKQKSLKKWGSEDWGTKSGKPSTVGPKATGERYLPKKAIQSLSSKEYAKTSAKKRAGMRAGKQFVPNTPTAKRVGRKARGK